jgi:hypothetical protein
LIINLTLPISNARNKLSQSFIHTEKLLIEHILQIRLKTRRLGCQH